MRSGSAFLAALALLPGLARALTPTPTPFACAPASSQAASLVLFQNDFASHDPNQGGTASASTANSPTRMALDGNRLIVSDIENHRVLIFNSLPSSSSAAADLVLGQNDFSSTSANQGGLPGANTLNHPHSVVVDPAGRLIVVDNYNNRVLVYNAVPVSSGASADLVLGQPDFSSNQANQGGPTTASTLYWPAYAWSDGTRLVVGDTYNHRVLLWNSFPTSNGQAADLVVGQSSFSGNTQGWSATQLHYPQQAEIFNNSLYVADTNNGRVEVFSPVPSSNGAAATASIGQAFAGSWGQNRNATTPTASTLSWPNGFHFQDGNLWISDYGNDRVVRHAPAPIASDTAADIVLGQPDFASWGGNHGVPTNPSAADTLFRPNGLLTGGGKLWITDSGNNRMLAYACPATSPTSTPTPSATATATLTSTPVNTPVATLACDSCAAFCETWEGPGDSSAQWNPAPSSSFSVITSPASGSKVLAFPGVATWQAAEYGAASYLDPDFEARCDSNPAVAYLLTNLSGGFVNALWCTSCYQLAVNPNLNEIVIRKVDGGGMTMTDLNAGNTSFPLNLSGYQFRLRLKKSGNQLSAYVDGVLYVTVTDPSPLGAGRVGLQSYDQARYDDLVVRDGVCPTFTVTPSATPSASPSPSPTETPTATPSPSWTPSPTRSATPSASPTATASPTVSATPSPSPTPSASPVGSGPGPAPTPRGGAEAIRLPGNGGRRHDGTQAVSVRFPAGGGAEIRVVGSGGRVVRHLWQGLASADGVIQRIWDGKDDDGKRCSSGVYHVVLLIDGRLVSRSSFIIAH